MDKNIVNRIDELRERIKDADYKYYVLAQPDLEDSEYDLMMKELEELRERISSAYN